MSGTYKVIDLFDINLTTDGVTFEGVWEQFEGNRLPILLSNITIDGTEYHDAFVAPAVNDTTYSFVLYGYTWTIEHTDKITLAAVAAA